MVGKTNTAYAEEGDSMSEQMTATQLIKLEILQTNEELADFMVGKEVTPDNIDEIYREASDVHDYIQDEENEFRCSGEPTPEIRAPFSRHYECDAVARQVSGGQWVGWHYWHGGGKHGEPEAVEWMDDAYLLEITGTETVVRHTFKVAGQGPT